MPGKPQTHAAMRRIIIIAILLAIVIAIGYNRYRTRPYIEFNNRCVDLISSYEHIDQSALLLCKQWIDGEAIELGELATARDEFAAATTAHLEAAKTIRIPAQPSCLHFHQALLAYFTIGKDATDLIAEVHSAAVVTNPASAAQAAAFTAEFSELNALALERYSDLLEAHMAMAEALELQIVHGRELPPAETDEHSEPQPSDSNQGPDLPPKPTTDEAPSAPAPPASE